jgi:hypothetical protein
MPQFLRDSKNLHEGLATKSAGLQELQFTLQASWRHTNVAEENSLRTADSVVNPSLRTEAQLPILLGDSKNLREAFTP